MTLDEFVSKAFKEHGDDASAVFARLPQGFELSAEAKHLPSFAHLIEHVSGEHLGRWSEGIALLERLERLSVFDAATPQGKAVLRAKAVLHRCAGNRAEEARCLAASRTGGDVPEASDRIRVLALTSAAFLARRRTGEARRDLEECVTLAAYGPTKADPAARSLAVTANDMAIAFENRETLTDDERAFMLRAASVARDFWEIAGGHYEVGNAEYRLAMSHIKAGDGRTALAHAANYLRINRENGDDPGEAFFAHEALSRARLVSGDPPGARRDRESMAALLPKVADESFRTYCAKELAKLDAVLAGG